MKGKAAKNNTIPITTALSIIDSAIAVNSFTIRNPTTNIAASSPVNLFMLIIGMVKPKITNIIRC